MQIGGRNCPDTPISFGPKCLLLIWTGSCHNKLVTMYICCLCRHCSQLACFLGLKNIK